MDLEKLASDTLSQLKRHEKPAAEVFVTRVRSTKIDILDKEIEALEETGEIGLAIRVIKDQKLGFSYTAELDEDGISSAIEQALHNSQSAESDQLNQFPLPPKTAAPLSFYDPAIDNAVLANKIELAKEAEAAAYRADPRIKKTEKVIYADGTTETVVVNTNGVQEKATSNHCEIYVDVIAVQGQEMESGFGIQSSSSFKELDPQKVGAEAAKRAGQLLGAKSISSQKLPLIIDPLVGSQLLQVLAATLSAESVQKGKSLFRNLIGQAVGSTQLTIIDNGRLKGGIASSAFDAEGTPTRETVLIQNGILKTYLHNCYSAAKDNTQSTGNAVRSSYKAQPQIGNSNLFIAGGTADLNSLLKNMGRAFYLTRVMGVHTANPINGDFSFGAAGIMIENGAFTYPVRSITIAGNLIDMLKNIDQIGNDLRFFGEVGSPTLLVNGFTLSGS